MFWTALLLPLYMVLLFMLLLLLLLLRDPVDLLLQLLLHLYLRYSGSCCYYCSSRMLLQLRPSWTYCSPPPLPPIVTLDLAAREEGHGDFDELLAYVAMD